MNADERPSRIFANGAMSNSYTHVSNKDSSRINSPSDDIMQGAFDDNGIGVQAKGRTNRVWIFC